MRVVGQRGACRAVAHLVRVWMLWIIKTTDTLPGGAASPSLPCNEAREQRGRAGGVGERGEAIVGIIAGRCLGPGLEPGSLRAQPRADSNRRRRDLRAGVTSDAGPTW